MLFGMDGVEVTEAERGADGRLTVWARITLPAVCPGCGTVSENVHQYVTATPRDVRACGQDTDFFLVKRRMECAGTACPRQTFTESAPQVPPRCTITRRLLEHAGAEVADRGITPAEAARDAGISWPSAHGAFTAKAAESWAKTRPRSRTWALTSTAAAGPAGARTPIPGKRCSSRTGGTSASTTWTGTRACSARSRAAPSDDTAYWLAGATPAWRDAVQVVAIDMCTIFASAVSRMLPGASIAVDLFHVVQLAVKTTGDVRRRAIRELYGRRGKAGDPEYGIKSLLNRNLENLSPEQFEKVIETLDATAPGQQLAIAWIAKEKLRDALKLRARVTGSTPCERQVRDRLFTFYDWCAQNEDIPELQTLASTIARWENEIVTAVITGVTNATAESLNRLAKLEARHAYGFRNPANQRRRVRIACTRGTRRP